MTVTIAMTDDQRALSDAVGGWAAKRCTRAESRAHEHGPDRWRALWPELSGLGITGLCVAESHGGGGGSMTDLSVALEQAARALVPGPLLTTALAAVVLEGTQLGAELLSGQRSAGIAVHPAQLRRDGSCLHGVVRPVLGATPDSVLVVTDGDTCWAVPTGDAAAETVAVVAIDAADFSRPLAEARLSGARAIEIDGLTPERLADLAATCAAAESAGLAAWSLQTASDYAKVREQFGKPIGSFQAIKALCTQMLCRAELASAVAWDAAQAAQDPMQHPASAAAAATLAIEAAVENAKDCIQVLGGIGFTWEHDAHLYLRRALALRHFVGGAHYWQARAARLAAAGVRRELRVALGRADDRVTVRERVAAIAATPQSERRAALADSGYLMPHWPAPYGLDADPRLQLIIDEELAAADVTRPNIVIAGWAIPTILRHGSPEQIERFAGPTLRGEITWCQLFSEPGAGSDLAALRTRAERVDGGWSLNGQKVWTSLAHDAEWAICLARTNAEAPKHKGITYFLLDMSTPGIEIRPLREMTGEQLFNEVFLDDVFIPDAMVVGEIDAGWPLVRTTLSHERVAMGGGSSIGDAVEQLIKHAGSDDSLADPLLAARLGRLVVEGLAGSVLDLRSALHQLDGRSDDSAASVRKLVGVQHRQDVAELALELLGPDGQIAGEQLQQFLTSRCLSIAGGTTQVLSNVAAERILGLPRG